MYFYLYVTSGWSILAAIKFFPLTDFIFYTSYFVNYHTDSKQIKQTSKQTNKQKSSHQRAKREEPFW